MWQQNSWADFLGKLSNAFIFKITLVSEDLFYRATIKQFDRSQKFLKQFYQHNKVSFGFRNEIRISA